MEQDKKESAPKYTVENEIDPEDWRITLSTQLKN
jgi:hypothetical protein